MNPHKRYCCDRRSIEDYYCSQSGNGLPVYQGYSGRQKGYGLGGLFRGLMKSVVPLFKSGAKALGKRALSTGLNVAQDVLGGQSFGESAKKRMKETGRNMLQDLQRYPTSHRQPQFKPKFGHKRANKKPKKKNDRFMQQRQKRDLFTE